MASQSAQQQVSAIALTARARLLNRSERRSHPQHRHRRAENQVVIVKLAGKEGCQRARRRRRGHAQRQHRAFFSQRQRAQTEY